MRREGYEFQVSRPEVIFHQAEDGTQLEPYEEVHIETSPDTVGVVVEMLGGRRGKNDGSAGIPARVVYGLCTLFQHAVCWDSVISS